MTIRIARGLGATIGVAVALALTTLAAVAVAPTPVSAAAPPTATVSATTWRYERVFSQPPTFDPPVTVSVSGGTGPYTCSWQKVGGDPHMYAENVNSCSTRWVRPLNGVQHTFYCEAGWVAVITDAAGATTTTPVVVASFMWELGD